MYVIILVNLYFLMFCLMIFFEKKVNEILINKSNLVSFKINNKL